jgi:predicted TIM-barrel fold metal-dependent hydrolase
MQLTEGTTDLLLEQGSKAGITKYVVHSCATKAEQVRSINEFVKSELDKHDNFIGFMTLHQDLTEEQIYDEVSWGLKNGFKGIKLHPDFQKFYIDDQDAKKFYRVVEDKMPILFHTGDDRYEYSKPIKLVNIARKFPNTTFIAAHFGGYRCWDDANLYCGLKNVYFDTCSSLPFISAERARELINMHGADRFFFGTDFPMWDAASELGDEVIREG